MAILHGISPPNMKCFQLTLNRLLVAYLEYLTGVRP